MVEAESILADLVGRLGGMLRGSHPEVISLRKKSDKGHDREKYHLRKELVGWGKRLLFVPRGL